MQPLTCKHTLSVGRQGGHPEGQWDPAEPGAPPGSQTGPSQHTGSQAEPAGLYVQTWGSQFYLPKKRKHTRGGSRRPRRITETLWACTGRARKSSLHAVPRGSARGSEHRTKLHAALSSRQSRWMRWSPASAMLWFFWKRNLSTTPVLSKLEKWYTFWLSSTKNTTLLPEFYKHIIPKRLGTTDLQDCWHFKHRNSENCWTEDLMKIQSSRVSKCCYIKVITELPKQHCISDKDGHVSGYNSPACRHLRVSTSQPGGLGWVTCLLS